VLPHKCSTSPETGVRGRCEEPRSILLAGQIADAIESGQSRPGTMRERSRPLGTAGLHRQRSGHRQTTRATQTSSVRRRLWQGAVSPCCEGERRQVQSVHGHGRAAARQVARGDPTAPGPRTVYENKRKIEARIRPKLAVSGSANSVQTPSMRPTPMARRGAVGGHGPQVSLHLSAACRQRSSGDGSTRPDGPGHATSSCARKWWCPRRTSSPSSSGRPTLSIR